MPPSPPPPAPARVRLDIARIGPQLESLRRGIAVMKSLPSSDPRSWRYQANIHGTTDPVTSPLFNQCQHGTLLFLAWHRGYIYYFERILRWASGDHALSLPYWDWSQSPAVPEPFRSPASESNSLYEERRALNDGSALPAEIVVDALNLDLAQTAFTRPGGVGFSRGLEASPHGTIHTTVGGIDGTMSAVDTAANDPIFWLHHCNIDRLWDRWLNLGAGRSNPTGPEFNDVQFSYADEAGAVRTHRVREILASWQLGYRYDDVPNPAHATAPTLMVPTAIAATPAGDGPSQSIPMASSAPRGGAVADSKPLGLDTETVRLEPQAPARAAAPAGGEQATTLHPPRVLLQVEGISLDAAPDFTYGVYLNIPEGQTASARTREHLVGMLNFFGRTPGDAAGAHDHDGAHGDAGLGAYTQTFDVTDVVDRLRQKGLWDEEAAPRVDLRPLLPVAPRGSERAVRARAQASAQRANVRYRSIQLLASP